MKMTSKAKFMNLDLIIMLIQHFLLMRVVSGAEKLMISILLEKDQFGNDQKNSWIRLYYLKAELIQTTSIKDHLEIDGS